MSFKVPIGYRQLEGNNTEVVYDDNTTWDWVNGSGGGEGDDAMIVNFDIEEQTLDKTYKELKDSAIAGKIIVLQGTMVDEDEILIIFRYYLSELNNGNEGEYVASFGAVNSDNGDATPYVLVFKSETETGVLTQYEVA